MQEIFVDASGIVILKTNNVELCFSRDAFESRKEARLAIGLVLGLPERAITLEEQHGVFTGVAIFNPGEED